MERSGGRNYNIECLFRSLSILEKQQLVQESALKLFWVFGRLDEMEAREVMRKFADPNLVRCEQVDGCISKEGQFCVRLHDLMLELCRKMKAGEYQDLNIGLINAYRPIVEGGRATEIG